MATKIEVYWEVGVGSVEPTVVDLMKEGKIPSSSICRVEPELGIMKNYLEMTSQIAGSDSTDHKITEAINWIWKARQEFGIRYLNVLFNGHPLSIQVLRFEMAVNEAITGLREASARLKATRVSVRNSEVGDVRREIDAIISRMMARIE